MSFEKRVLILISGTSRGLGKELSMLFSDYEIVGINRQKQYATDIVMDLSQPEINLNPIINLLNNYHKVVYINNASTINPIENIQTMNAEDIDSSTYTNFINPSKIITTIIKSKVDYIIINVTTGAAFTANTALSIYSSTKAAMHRFIDILEKEQMEQNQCLMITNFNPGRMQTDMQKLLLNKKGMNSDIYNECKTALEVAYEIVDLVKEGLSAQ